MEEGRSSRETLKCSVKIPSVDPLPHVFELQAYGPSHPSRSRSLMNLTVLVEEVMAPPSRHGYLLSQGDSGWMAKPPL